MKGNNRTRQYYWEKLSSICGIFLLDYNPCYRSFLAANIECQAFWLSLDTGEHQASEQEYPMEPSLTMFPLSFKERQDW